MTARREVSLGTVQETLLIPLHGGPVENPGPDSAPRAARAEEIFAATDRGFARFDDLPGPAGAVPRAPLFDQGLPDLLTRRPGSTVVEPGAGPGTRYGRTGSGRACRFELVPPDAIDVRRSFLSGTPRRPAVAASVTVWAGIGERLPGPCRPWTRPARKPSLPGTGTLRSARPRRASCEGSAPVRPGSPLGPREPGCPLSCSPTGLPSSLSDRLPARTGGRLPPWPLRFRRGQEYRFGLLPLP